MLPVDVQPGSFMSRAAASFALVLAGFAAFAPASARADSGPVIVIPSRPGVPVVINGRDASYAVVEGDWGLSRPGAVPVTVIGGSPILPNAVYTPAEFVSFRNMAARRSVAAYEVEPAADRALPEPAESFSRSWSTSSDVAPANDTRSAMNRAQPINFSDADNVPATITDPQTFQSGLQPVGHYRSTSAGGITTERISRAATAGLTGETQDAARRER